VFFVSRPTFKRPSVQLVSNSTERVFSIRDVITSYMTLHSAVLSGFVVP